MAGFSSVTGDESIMFADNVSFDGTQRGGRVSTDGQLLIGSTASPHIKVGTLTSTGGTITITPGSGTINLETAGGDISIDEINVDAATGPGTNPVVADANGEITVTGGQVATGTIGANVIRTNSLAANTYTIEIQRSTTAASADSSLNGVCHFDSSSFSVDSDGFVTFTGGASTAGVVITEFTSSGTWNVDPNATWVQFYMGGAGGGGGSGRRGAAGSDRRGGSGGGGGGSVATCCDASLLSASYSITIGAGGTGATGETVDNSNGNNGGTGGVTQVASSILIASGGISGTGGGTSDDINTAGLPVATFAGGGSTVQESDTPKTVLDVTSGIGGYCSSAGAIFTPNCHATIGGAGGGAGGGVTTSNTQQAGGIGGNMRSTGSTTYENGGTAGSAGGGAGGNGGTRTLSSFYLNLAGGSGGGGGGGRASGGPGGAGGDGGRSAGGGGGGASVNGQTSGAGGDGGSGFIRIVEFLS